ncbi:MAG: hypothetical protein JRF43_04105 [Deltaproteobacteria bacterium]|nr:hypothetical protein [Deltaproteobacteria bacterium]
MSVFLYTFREQEIEAITVRGKKESNLGFKWAIKVSEWMDSPFKKPTQLLPRQFRILTKM